MKYVLLIALPLAAALYWTLFHRDAGPMPALAPPVSSMAPAPAEAADEGARDAVRSGVETPATAETAAEIALQPPVPRDAAGTGRTARAAAADPEDAPETAATAGTAGAASVAAAAPATPLLVQRSPSPLVAAHAALRAGDLARAEGLYRQTLAGEPDQPDARLGMALIEQSRGATAAALAHYRAVLQQRPDDPQAWAGMADLATEAELLPMESRLRYLAASRPDPALRFALGNVLARQSRWPEAQESYFSAATGAPSNADYAFNLAVALDRLGKGRAAIPHYARALQLAGDGRAVQFDAAAVRARVTQLEGAAP
jgi:tetratricopeptide (TPR) repeat protein